MANSYTPPDRSTYDPGWNDPPPMPSAAAATDPSKPRTSLNKRVAFPMQSSAASQTSVKTTAEGLPLPYSTAKYQQPPMYSTSPPTRTSSSPPPPPPLLPPPSSSMSSINSTQSATEKDNFDSATACEQCHSIFGHIADKMDATEPTKLNEIRKRLESLHQMWQENKLDDAVQRNLCALAKALENEDSAAAMVQHRNLVTQHINVSTHWATALRQLILTLCPGTESNAQNSPAQLPTTEIVQFVDVSTKPVVLDNNPSFLQGPMNQPLPLATDESTETQQMPSKDINEDGNPNAESSTIEPNQNAAKSKFGRFGRILHI